MSTSSTINDPSSVFINAPAAGAKPRRYHAALVVLHWLIAIMIFGTVLLVQENEGGRERFEPGQTNPPAGTFQQGTSPENFRPEAFPGRGENQGLLTRNGIHMIIGFAILVLLLVRLVVRFTTRHPEWASAGNKFFDWVGSLTHLGLYVLTFAMVITGIILADQRGMLARTFGIGSIPTPGSFGRGGFSLGFLHGGIWTLLLLLILLHIGAALYHQFILKDHLLGRMWFGRENGPDLIDSQSAQ